jgi:hypothetical protein
VSTASRRAGRVGRTLKPANKSKSHSNFITTPPLARNGLRQYQKEAVATVLDYLKNEQGSPCLDIAVPTRLLCNFRIS